MRKIQEGRGKNDEIGDEKGHLPRAALSNIKGVTKVMFIF
jgi:hypothetical protein